MADSKSNYPQDPTSAQINAHRNGLGDTSAATLAKLKAQVAAQKVTDTKNAIDKLTKQGLAYADVMDNALTQLKITQNQLNKVTVVSYRQSGTTLTFTVKASDAHLVPSTLGAFYIHDLSNTYAGSYVLGRHTVDSISGANISVTVTTSNTFSAISSAGQMWLSTFSGDELHTLEKQWKAYDAAVTQWENNGAKLQALDASYKNIVPPGAGSGGGGGGKTPPPAGSVNITPDNGPVEYNVSSVKSAYFRADASETVLFTDGGSPATASVVKNASDLWRNANDGAHKGMFQTYNYWNLNSTQRKGLKKTDPNLPSWYGTSYQKQRYGFQFLYNPSEVNMDWGGTPNVDPGLMMSGKDATPFIVPQASSSNISFNLILNRMPDVGIINTYGAKYVADHMNDFYGRVPPAVNGNRDIVDDLTAIQNLGTMYDIEYLLSTLVGFRSYSDLRYRWTSDIGFLMGLPVELHLGKDLRYLGTINYLSVTHTIFGKGMVPLFTNVQIGFARRIEPSQTNQVNSKGDRIGATNGSLTPNLGDPQQTADLALFRQSEHNSINPVTAAPASGGYTSPSLRMQ